MALIIQRKPKHLTTHLATLFSAPVEAVVAPGPNKVLVLFGALYEWNSGSGIYTAQHLGGISYGADPSLGLILDPLETINGESVARVQWIPTNPALFSERPLSRARAENQPLMITADTDPEITGPADGDLWVTLYYWMEPLH